ncbi:MAG: 50S ribosomal protein L21 [Candidatus Taylorbacteria bacterium]|nr:50S ribosomal protein L21 [Candidatus Taylorbacteria bacterium]
MTAEAKKEFAVFETGGKQYQVSVGDTLRVEKIRGQFRKGDTITFSKVLLVESGTDTTLGTPYISGAVVEAVYEEEGRLPKVNVIKYKQKSRYFVKRGHRQPFFKIRIVAIK